VSVLHRNVVLILVGVVSAVVALGCSDSVEPGKDEVRILVNNGGVPGAFSVTVDGPSMPATTIPVSQGAFVSDEFPGKLGDVITFSATRPAEPGLVAAAGSGSCTAGPDIVGVSPHPAGAQYGQVDFGVNGAVIDVICSSGWQ